MSLLPNTLTVIRILLVLPIGWTLWIGLFETCLVLLIIAGVSDTLDGFLARRFNSTSRFGEVADPIADKLLALVVVSVMLLTGLLPLWASTIIIGREVVILGGAIAFRSIVQRLDIEPLMISRINTSVLIVVLCAIIASQTDVPQLSTLTARFVDPVGVYLMVLFTVVSGVAYVYTWSVRLKEHLAVPEKQPKPTNP